MKNAVIIKGNRYGIALVLDANVEFPILLESLKSRLEGAEEFFDSDKQLAITFEGRTLSNEELDQILTTIQEHSKLNIQYVIDENSELETTYFDVIQNDLGLDDNQELDVSSATLDENNKENTINAEEKGKLTTIPKENNSMFYRGTLRAKQILEAKNSIVIIGDVLEGASVIANGNIIVIGTLRGTAKAGKTGDKNAFVMALSMYPEAIQIANVMWKETSKKKKVIKNKQNAMIATIQEDKLCMETVSKTILQDMSY